jgi:predicted GIY-YIG superfamily endonuclease
MGTGVHPNICISVRWKRVWMPSLLEQPGIGDLQSGYLMMQILTHLLNDVHHVAPARGDLRNALTVQAIRDWGSVCAIPELASAKFGRKQLEALHRYECGLAEIERKPPASIEVAQSQSSESAWVYPASRGLNQVEGGEHWVYLLFGVGNRLLYVGSTSRGMERLMSHYRKKTWFPEVVSIGIESYATRLDALRREMLLIQLQAPAYNIQHNLGRTG